MRLASALFAIAASLLPATALAQASEPRPAIPAEHRLSPEQIELVLAEAAKKRQAADRQAMPVAVESRAPRQIHGELGVSVGTGGYREVFGTAIYPMGDDGAAAISLDFLDLGRRRFKR